MSEKSKKIVKCEGRFHEFRDNLYEELIPVVVGDDPITLQRNHLDDIWCLLGEDIYRFDRKDPYYDSRQDLIRKAPNKDSLSLVPLLEAHTSFDAQLAKEYALSMGNRESVSGLLASMVFQPRRFLQESFGRDPKSINLPCGKNLSGYNISANFGIGTLSQGGLLGGGVRSDSPFLLEIYHNEREGANLAAVVGFWAQDNKMLVSQIQSCKNAHLPKESNFGAACLHVAETVANLMGFSEIMSYTARGHPIFLEHPDSWGQLGPDFVCIWDNSAKKLHYEGSRNGKSYHHKVLSPK